MTNLLTGLVAILSSYSLLMYLVMKRFLPWKYKAFIYGGLTFLMLIGVFQVFALYDLRWKAP